MTRVSWLWIAAFIFISSLSHAHTTLSTHCERLLSSATGADDVIDVYRKLLTEVGAELVTNNDLRRMLESGDYFTLGDSGASMKDHLREALLQVKLAAEAHRVPLEQLKAVVEEIYRSIQKHDELAVKRRKWAEDSSFPYFEIKPVPSLRGEMRFLPNGKTLITTNALHETGGNIDFWDLDKKKHIHNATPLGGTLERIVSPDTSLALFYGSGGTPGRIINLASANLVNEHGVALALKGPRGDDLFDSYDQLMYPKFSSDNANLYGIGKKSSYYSLYVFDTRSGELRREIVIHGLTPSSRIISFNVAPDESYIFLAAKDVFGLPDLYFVDLQNDKTDPQSVKIRIPFAPQEFKPGELFITRNGLLFGLRDKSGQICVWSAKDRKLKYQLQLYSPIPIFQMSRDSTFLVAKLNPGSTTALVDAETGAIKTFLGEKPSRAVAISPDNQWIAVADDAQANFYDAHTGKLADKPAFPSKDVDSLAFSDDSSRLAIGGPGYLRIVDLKRWLEEPK